MKTWVGLLALALALVLVWQWHDWPPAAPGLSGAPPASPTTQVPSQTAENPLDRLSLLEDKEKYAPIAERPLFLVDRRPPAEAPNKEGKVKLEPPSNLARLNLSTILITPSESFALVWDPGQKASVRLRLGDELEGWSVREILSDRVQLERQGEQNTLVLRDYKNLPPPKRRPTAPKLAQPPPPTADKGALQARSPKGRPENRPPGTAKAPPNRPPAR
ncbi:type II secretion system protein N [Candidatus Thiosymbion oneisti]|uniref:type II secretion system protein N n=1 Tax=Candidatus Thiosymbion oneisti TaxID=589554 RepID=UPI0013FE3D64|nr:type II secretion system protein N [Candidatus Thiosymbion oneisti]